MAYTILSAGIDIGTTTTQLIFSRLTLEKFGGYGVAPRVEVVNREVIYRSEIYFTPLTAEDTIDGVRVAALIKKEYEKAGIASSDLKTGAVIITGETAKKQNAEEVTMAMSELAGEFVVAAAGPDLESVLAGKGAGADLLSIKTGKSVLNIDIGGGTSNLCLFEEGIQTDSACFDIGGRVIRFDRDRKIEKITPKVEELLKDDGIKLKTGDVLTEELGEKAAGVLADLLAEAANLKALSDIGRKFETNHGLNPESRPALFSFSGGVADCMNKEYSDPFIYGDIGIFLAQAIIKHPLWINKIRVAAKETMRATVIGAGNCSMELSGSTIFCQNVTFPIKNLPVQRLKCSSQEQIDTLAVQLAALKDQHVQNRGKGYAIALDGPVSPTFPQVETIADLIANVLLEEAHVIPVILEHDFAKALGQAIKRRVPREKAVLCLDGVTCQSNDFIDIGKPVGGGIALPVVVKTLIFPQRRNEI